MHRSSGKTINVNGAAEALPKSFVTTMRILFDIMDDHKTGYVRLTDIEKGWQDDGCKGLPHGFIESLRNVTPANGLVSFERFCAGLKICLMRNHIEGKPQRISIDNNGQSLSKETSIKPKRPPSAPLLDIENPGPAGPWTSNNTATVRPNNVIQSPDGSDMDVMSDAVISADIYAPPKPPRITVNNDMHKAEIRHALQNWQMGILMNEMDAKDKRKGLTVGTVTRLIRGSGDGGSNEISQIQSSPQSPNNTFQKKPNVKRREPRRHTLQNGIDYNMLKRLKQFEEEKDILVQGLTAIEKAREWYLKQIANVQEKIKYLGHVGSHEPWSEAHQERLDLQRARVLEINRHLSALAESWERGGFPLHMNLAVRHRQSQYFIQQTTNADQLKQQNRQLTDEVSQKSERITLLEHEKQSLIRELLQIQRSRDIISAKSKSAAVLDNSDVVF